MIQEINVHHEKGKDSLFKTWHAAKNNMFIYMHSDGGSIVCGEGSYPIKRGVLCFISAGKFHYTMPSPPEDYERSKIFISPEKLDKIFALLKSESGLPDFSNASIVYAIIPESELDAADEIFREIAANRDDAEYGDMYLLSGCIRLLALLKKHSLNRIPSVTGMIHKSVEYINENIQHELDIDEICRHVHISKYHFCRVFKQATGLTVMNYILKTRLVLARSMLTRQQEYSVSEVSARCGFSSPAYFSRVFKQETGVSPLQYRNNH